MFRMVGCLFFVMVWGALYSQHVKGVACRVGYYAAHVDSSGRIFLRNEQSGVGRKVGVAMGYTIGYEAAIYGLLYVLPEDVSKWNSASKRNFGSNYKRTFTQAMVLDKDRWYVNYLGHPYQGTFYYNSMRAQGAEMWQSSMFAFANTFVWEFLLEGAVEQPSVQDLLVTPIAGTLLGELFHFATMRMSRNGYRWYEKAFVCVFNPAFAMHNGFKWAKPKRMDL